MADLDLQGTRLALQGAIARAEEAERLLRLTCARIVDGENESPTLAALQARQSRELADCSLAITTAYVAMRTNRETQRTNVKAQRRRADEAEKKYADLQAWLRQKLTEQAKLSLAATADENVDTLIAAKNELTALAKFLQERHGGPQGPETAVEMAMRLIGPGSKP